MALWLIGLATVVAGTGVLLGRADLMEQQVQVEQRRAQLDNVRLRQQQVAARLKDTPANSERNVELAGSENRVAIEARRYDEAASAYNRTAQTLAGRGAAALFGLPPRLPFAASLGLPGGGGT
jgi:hypothetical protein